MKVTGRSHITMTRGDADYLIMPQNPFFPIVEGDTVLFTAKPWSDNPEEELDDLEPVIQIEVTEFEHPSLPVVIKIPSEATKGLPYGDYYYDLEVIKANGDPQTIIKSATLTLTLEVHVS